MTASFELFCTNWSELHSGVEIKGVVKGWLRISFLLARSLSKLSISAGFITFLGVLFAAGTAFASPSAWCAIFLLLSILCDGIDGSVALLKNQAGRMGALLDSVADRFSEGLWAIALYRLGVSLPLVVTVWVLAAIQEFARARLGSDGVREIGVVTIAERPVRAGFLFLAIVVFQFSATDGWTNPITFALAAFELIALIQVLRFAYTSLT